MIRSIRQPNSAWRHVLMALGVLAIALRIIIPPGFMPAAATTTNPLPFALVLCTGKGAVTVQAGQALPLGDKPAPTKQAHESPCVFAGQALATPPPAWAIAEPTLYQYEPQQQARPLGLAPARSATGPPLPARGPPILTA
jgi:hypothetical protein